MAKKSLIKTIALAVVLALAGKAYAQDNSFYNRTSDFMLVTNYVNSLDRNKETSMDKLLRGGNVTSIYAMDAIEGLKGKIAFLNSARGKSFYNTEQRELLIGRYNSFIADIAKEQRSPNYSFSLEKLSQAASDGKITPEELYGIEDGTYMLVKEGIDSEVGKYSVPALVKLEKRVCENPIVKETPCVKPVVKETPCVKPEIKPIIKEPAKKQCDDDFNKALREATGRDSANENRREELRANNYASKEVPAKENPSVKTDWSLTFGAQSNTAFDNFGGNIGFRAYPNQGNVGLGLAAEVGFGKDKQLVSYKDVLIDNLSAVGTVNSTNNFSLGASGELQLGWFLFGGGINYRSSILEKDVKILEGNEVIKANSDSLLEKNVSGKAYAGIEVPISNKFGLDVLGGYDSKDGTFFGLKSNIKLNK
jgi:hypothetical protein